MTNGALFKAGQGSCTHFGALVPDNMIWQVWSGALAFVWKNTGLHGVLSFLEETSSFSELAYPQGVTTKVT